MTRVECASVQDLLPARLRGELDRAENEQVDRHVEVCEACAEEIVFVRWLVENAAQPPPGLAARIVRALQEERVRRPEPARWKVAARTSALRRHPAAWALASAAMLVLALGTSVLLNRNGAPSEEEVWMTFFDGVRSVWVGGDGVVAGAPVLEDLSDLSDAQLSLLLEELGG